MQKKRRRGRTSTKTSVEDEIAHLRGLDLGCGFRFIPAGFSDVKPATVPI
jgi:hypothetical protein